jgi:hypothetical protein
LTPHTQERMHRFWFTGACDPRKRRRTSSKPLALAQFTSAFILLGGENKLIFETFILCNFSVNVSCSYLEFGIFYLREIYKLTKDIYINQMVIMYVNPSSDSVGPSLIEKDLFHCIINKFRRKVSKGT